MRYRNVICPWQTPAEIAAQVKFVERMERALLARGWTQQQVDSLLGLDQPNRIWKARGE